MRKILAGLLLAIGLVSSAWAVDDFTTYRPLESYVISTATSSSTTVATPMTQGRFIVRVFATTDSFIAFASTRPFASTATGMVLAAGIPEYFRISQGEYIAIRASSTNGVLHITQMGR